VNGLSDLSTFLTASGLVTAVLILWVQLWGNRFEVTQAQGNQEERRWAIAGVAWNESAVLVAVISFVWAVVGIAIFKRSRADIVGGHRAVYGVCGHDSTECS